MSSDDLPSGWAETTFADACEVVGGGTPSTKDASFWGNEISWLTPADLSGYTSIRISQGARGITQEGLAGSAARLLPAGTVLFSSRAPIGHVAIAASELATNQGFKSLVPPSGITSEYLYWYLRWSTPAIKAAGSGTTFAEVSGAVMGKFPLLVPPTNEQIRIVAEVERRLSHLTAAEDSLRRAKRKLSSARVSVLRAAVDGSLANSPAEGAGLEDALEAEGLPFERLSGRPGWVRVRIDTIAKVGSGSTPKRGNSRYWDGGTIPWVTSGQLLGGTVSEPAALVTQAALDETAVKLWPQGTLLVAMYGEGRTRGHCAELLIEATCNQACAAISLKPAFNGLKDFLHLVLDEGYERNRVLGSGGVQENLNLGLVKSIEVDLPPVGTMEVLLTEAARRLSLVEAAQRNIDAQLDACARARKSILASAFKGELVGQDPDDEPASALLERIRTEREAKTAGGRTPRRRRAPRETAE